MNLTRVKLEGRYKCLENNEFIFDNSGSLISAFIGLNGCGKSQLMELIAEALCFLERDNRIDFNVRHSLSFSLIIEFETDASLEEESEHFKIHLHRNGKVDYHKRTNSASWLEQNRADIPLPRYLVGYSSGNNQNLERPFLKNHLQYNNVIRVRELRQERLRQTTDENRENVEEFYASRYPGIFPSFDDYGHLTESDTPPSSAVFLDYDCCTLILASLSMLPRQDLDTLFPDIEFRYPEKFSIRYNLRRRSIARDFYDDIGQLIRVVGEESLSSHGNWMEEEDPNGRDLPYPSATIHFDLTDESKFNQLRENFYSSPLTLFLKLYRLQLLGAREWQARDKRALGDDRFFGNVKKPLKTELPLEVFDVQMANGRGASVSLDDLSDGEAQLLTVLGACRIFTEDSSLFIFDEPEAHLNPHWRTDFHRLLEKAIKMAGNPGSHALVSTHSPFMISSLRKENVFRFERDEDTRSISMAIAETETYGTSIEVLMKQYFELKTLMPTTAIDEIKARLENNRNDVKQWISTELGESMEKAYLLRRLED